MKKRLAFVLCLLVSLGVAAFAGPHPYFRLENQGFDFVPSFTGGGDFEAKYVDGTALSISGDFFVTEINLLVPFSSWIGGFDLGFWLVDETLFKFFILDIGMDIQWTPTPFWGEIELNSWTTSVTLTGCPSSVMTVWGGVDIAFLDGVVVPVIGIEVRWP